MVPDIGFPIRCHPCHHKGSDRSFGSVFFAPVELRFGIPKVAETEMHLSRLAFVSMTSVLMAILALPAHADWKGKGEAGLVMSSGNTDAQSGNLKLSTAREGEKWKNQFGLAALYSSDEDGATAQRWEAVTQQDYNFSSRTFWFGAGRFEDDRFSGFDYQATVSTGLGRKFIDKEATQFVGTVGVGYKFFETRDAFDEETGALIEEGEREDDAVLRGTLDYEHDLTATTKIANEFIVEAGADNTYVQNDVSLQVKMTEVLALAIGYGVRHNTKPPAGFEKTDQLTTVNLVYEIK
jgi:putative salt-induced outer membrane protein